MLLLALELSAIQADIAPQSRSVQELEALLRHAVGQVARDGARDQVREDIVVEAAPPA